MSLLFLSLKMNGLGYALGRRLVVSGRDALQGLVLLLRLVVLDDATVVGASRAPQDQSDQDPQHGEDRRLGEAVGNARADGEPDQCGHHVSVSSTTGRLRLSISQTV